MQIDQRHFLLRRGGPHSLGKIAMAVGDLVARKGPPVHRREKHRPAPFLASRGDESL